MISGNSGYGVVLVDTGTSGNVVAGNLVGTNATGSAALGNAIDGVFLDDGASDNLIGGTTAAARNIISANLHWGVEILSSNDNLVQGNDIGTDITGTVGLGNALDGIYIELATSNTIGGTAAGAGNVISGNAGDGIIIESADNAGRGQPDRHERDGHCRRAQREQWRRDFDGATGNTIGGTASGAGNVISGNPGDGVEITGSGTTGNLVAGNLVGTERRRHRGHSQRVVGHCDRPPVARATPSAA